MAIKIDTFASLIKAGDTLTELVAGNASHLALSHPERLKEVAADPQKAKDFCLALDDLIGAIGTIRRTVITADADE
jgi:hypothetical protein